jgi:hypothetical protein
MVEAIAGNAALSSKAAAEIVERADGVPLFVEELTRAVLTRCQSFDRLFLSVFLGMRLSSFFGVAPCANGSELSSWLRKPIIANTKWLIDR